MKTFYSRLTVIAFLFALLVPLSSFAQTNNKTAPLLLRAQGDSKIYMISNGMRYWIRTGDVFNAYYLSWNSVKEVPAQILNGYPLVRVIKKQGENNLYSIENGIKQWIPSPEVFNARGFDWKAIIDVNATDFNSYEPGNPLTQNTQTQTITIDLSPQSTNGMPQGVDFSMLWDAWRIVQEKYRGHSDLDTQKMVYGATEGLLKSLGDPYTVFFKPADATKFNQDIQGSFGGIGAELGYKKGIVIIAPLKDMPAEKIGLKAGDKIVRIDGTSTIDMTVEDAVTKIRGTLGTPVTLTIERAGTGNLLEFTIIRATITVSSVEWSKKSDLIAYIRIQNFFGSVESDFTKAVQEGKKQGLTKFIIDLRNNPGGLLGASINIAEQFIPVGKVIVYEDYGNGKKKDEFDSNGGGLLEKSPVVVLINGGSASASEILAGALKDSRGITLVGEKTFGKGSVQEVVQLSSGASVKVTVAKWLTPSGATIDQQGIEPDVKVELTDADREAGRDPQLDKAMQLIGNLW